MLSCLLALSVALLAACGSARSAQKGASPPGSSKGAAAVDTGSSSSLKPYSGSDKIIASSDSKTKAVTLNLIGGQKNSSNGFNFNGFSKGDMVIKIPEGWRVTVHFSVQSSLSHSAIIAPWSQREASTFTPAFPGSATPHYSSGINKSDQPIDFSFSAGKAGKYSIVCAVPGHDDLGMWDELDVVRGLSSPLVLVK